MRFGYDVATLNSSSALTLLMTSYTSAFNFYVECRTGSVKGTDPLLASNEALNSAGSEPSPPVSRDGSGGPVLRTGEKPLDRSSPTAPSVKPIVKVKYNPEGSKTPASERLHVLIVEDNIINQTVLKRQLTKSGFTCEGM